MLFDWINSNLESIFYLFLLLSVGIQVTGIRESILFLIISNIPSCINVFFPIHFLPLSMVMFSIVVCVIFRKEKLWLRIYDSFIAFLGSIILQFSLFAFLPLSLLQTNLGNFIGNLSIVCITGLLLLYVKKNHLQNVISSFLIKFRIIIFVLLAVFLILGQFYLFRLISIWEHLPGMIALLVLLLLVISVIVFIRYQQSADKMQADLFRQNMKSSQALTDTMRIQLHDYKHHIHHLQNLIASSTDSKALQTDIDLYVSQLDEDRSLYELLLSIDNPMIRAFLFGCYDQCSKNSIPLQIKNSALLPVFPLKEYQFIEVVENLFSNALEQNLSLPEEKRWIEITLRAEDGLQFFSIENPADQISLSIEKLYSMNVTTKKDGHQGLGLSSIQKILSQNGILFSGKRNPESGTIVFSFSYQEVPK